MYLCSVFSKSPVSVLSYVHNLKKIKHTNGKFLVNKTVF